MATVRNFQVTAENFNVKKKSVSRKANVVLTANSKILHFKKLNWQATKILIRVRCLLLTVQGQACVI